MGYTGLSYVLIWFNFWWQNMDTADIYDVQGKMNEYYLAIENTSQIQDVYCFLLEHCWTHQWWWMH